MFLGQFNAVLLNTCMQYCVRNKIILHKICFKLRTHIFNFYRIIIIITMFTVVSSFRKRNLGSNWKHIVRVD